MMINYNELILWLEADESKSRPYRANRLKVLIENFGSENFGVFYGGTISAVAFEEARQAYLHGLFISCTVMCQVCLEHMLAGLFRMYGRDDLDRAGFAKLLQEARDEGLITQSEFELFEQLRSVRNPYVHPPRLSKQVAFERRAVDHDTPVEELFKIDAEHAVKALLRLCQRPPFAVDPS